MARQVAFMLPSLEHTNCKHSLQGALVDICKFARPIDRASNSSTQLRSVQAGAARSLTKVSFWRAARKTSAGRVRTFVTRTESGRSGFACRSPVAAYRLRRELTVPVPAIKRHSPLTRNAAFKAHKRPEVRVAAAATGSWLALQHAFVLERRWSALDQTPSDRSDSRRSPAS